MPDRCQLLQQINEISFVVNDLNLYLDTHPTDDQALDTVQGKGFIFLGKGIQKLFSLGHGLAERV